MPLVQYIGDDKLLRSEHNMIFIYLKIRSPSPEMHCSARSNLILAPHWLESYRIAGSMNFFLRQFLKKHHFHFSNMGLCHNPGQKNQGYCISLTG